MDITILHFYQLKQVSCMLYKLEEVDDTPKEYEPTNGWIYQDVAEKCMDPGIPHLGHREKYKATKQSDWK